PYRPQAKARDVIEQANGIIEGYLSQGFKLTLRQPSRRIIGAWRRVCSLRAFHRTISGDCKTAVICRFDARDSQTALISRKAATEYRALEPVIREQGPHFSQVRSQKDRGGWN